MAYKLIGVGSKANSHICKFVADTYSDLANIPLSDKTFGTKALVVDTGRIYCLNSDLNWVPQKTKATLPDVTNSDNGKIMQVDNGAWTAVQPSGGSSIVLTTEWDEDADAYTDVDMTPSEIFTAIQSGQSVILIDNYTDLGIEYYYCYHFDYYSLEDGYDYCFFAGYNNGLYIDPDGKVTGEAPSPDNSNPDDPQPET